MLYLLAASALAWNAPSPAPGESATNLDGTWQCEKDKPGKGFRCTQRVNDAELTKLGFANHVVWVCGDQITRRAFTAENVTEATRKVEYLESWAENVFFLENPSRGMAGAGGARTMALTDLDNGASWHYHRFIHQSRSGALWSYFLSSPPNGDARCTAKTRKPGK